jgi:superfamily II DNA or RNA helicase
MTIHSPPDLVQRGDGDSQEPNGPPLFQVRIPAPTRSSLAVLGDEIVKDPFFGSIPRRRVYNLRHVYDPAFPPAFTIGEAANVEPTPLKHPLEMVMLDGPRPDPRYCLQRLRALWLRAENRGGQLDNDPVLPLRHQAALVDFMLRGESPKRILIADEVGLGKTVEAGLFIRQLLRREPQTRVLYLTLGGLVENVLEEFDRLDLPRWYYFGNVSTEAADRLNAIPVEAMTGDTRLVVASIHKLCASNRFEEQRGYLGDARFDLIIVDECHTLRAYGASADSQQVWFRAVRHLLDDHLVADGRALFLSATPHQGHREVFLNLTSLCTGTPLTAEESVKASAARGRVIFRIKEHIRDWDGRRIFPVREVRVPSLVAPPRNYQEVLEAITNHFDWVRESSDGPQARAVGFVKSQALQYAASSLRAGFAYLLRRLIRYHPHTAQRAEVVAWARRLVPYRTHTDDPEELLSMWQREQRTRRDEGEEELFGALAEGYGGLEFVGGEAERLIALLRGYDALFDDPNADTKLAELRRILEEADEPIVVFSQAVDTVYELEARLADMDFEVYRLTGDMEVDARMRSVRAFRTSRNPKRALISSAAGGIGINLQVARRVVHFDLPWNPMALEQRVGRVHRIGSTKTILVDTILLAGSREADVFARITSRLESIVADLSADPTEREALFRRILASMDPDRLRDILSGERGMDEVGAAVDEGRRAVEEADRQMSALTISTQEQRGLAETGHLLQFLRGADISLQKVRDEVFAVVSEADSGELKSVEKTAAVYSMEGFDTDLVFDRVAASYLGLRRVQTGGIGHPTVDALLWSSVSMQPESEKARSATWLAHPGPLPAELAPGSIVYVEGVAQYRTGELSSFRLEGRSWADGMIQELGSSALAMLLWDDGWAPTRKAGDFPGAPELFDALARQTVSADGDQVTVRWPIAAIGIREISQ